MRVILYQSLGYVHAVMKATPEKGDIGYCNQDGVTFKSEGCDMPMSLRGSVGTVVMSSDKSLGLPNIQKKIWREYCDNGKLTFVWESHKVKNVTSYINKEIAPSLDLDNVMIEEEEDDPNTVYVFEKCDEVAHFGPDIYHVMSVHKTHAGATAAIKADMIEEREEYIKDYGEKGELLVPFGSMTDWKIRKMQLLD